MIGKGEIIMGIIELYDELEASRNECDSLHLPLVVKHGENGCELSNLDARMLEAGRIKVYESCIYSWRELKATKDKETGIINVTSYAKWVKEKVSSVPDYMSKTDFCEYFSDRLEQDYEREKQEAIAKIAVEGESE